MTAIATNVSEEMVLAMGVDPTLLVSIVDVLSMTTRDASIVKVTAKVQDDIIEVMGTSKRAPEDRHDQEIGLMLASSRAYESLSRRLARRAQGLIDHYEYVKEQNTEEAREQRAMKRRLWQDYITRVASGDDAIQKAVLREAREAEGSWKPLATVSND